MEKYRVIKFFTDLQDKGYAYNVGDEFPRHGHKVSEARIAELSTTANKQHEPLIEVDKPKATAVPKKRSKKNADGDLSGTEELV